MEDGFGDMKLTQASLDKLEIRLDTMQKTLSKAVLQRRPGPAKRKGIRPMKRGTSTVIRNDCRPEDLTLVARTSRKPQEAHTLMRLVKTAFLVQEANGKPVVEMLAIADQQFESANDASKIAMVKYIQNFRLLVWLLRRDNLACTARACANEDSPGVLIKAGSLNTDYKRLMIPSEFLRWRQFSFVQNLHSPLHGDSVPTDSTRIIQSYFLCNEYGRNLFKFYLSLPRNFDTDENIKTFEDDSSDPAWVSARRQRMSFFMYYVDPQKWLRTRQGTAVSQATFASKSRSAECEYASACTDQVLSSLSVDPSATDLGHDQHKERHGGDTAAHTPQRTSPSDSTVGPLCDTTMTDVTGSEQEDHESYSEIRRSRKVSTRSHTAQPFDAEPNAPIKFPSVLQTTQLQSSEDSRYTQIIPLTDSGMTRPYQESSRISKLGAARPLSASPLKDYCKSPTSPHPKNRGKLHCPHLGSLWAVILSPAWR